MIYDQVASNAIQIVARLANRETLIHNMPASMFFLDQPLLM
jgi:hypothetical protein